MLRSCTCISWLSGHAMTCFLPKEVWGRTLTAGQNHQDFTFIRFNSIQCKKITIPSHTQKKATNFFFEEVSIFHYAWQCKFLNRFNLQKKKIEKKSSGNI